MNQPDKLLSSSVLGAALFYTLSALSSPLLAQLIVSELYRDPPGTETSLGGGLSHEFVEVTNLGPQAVALDSMSITNGLEADSIIPVRDTLPGHEQCRYNIRAIVPGATAVILDPDYRRAINEDASRRFTLPAGAALLQCGDAEFGASGLAADHGVIIYRGSKNRIDTVLCSAADAQIALETPTGGKITLTTPVNREGVSIVAGGILSDKVTFDYSSILSPGWYEPLRDGWIVEYRLAADEHNAGLINCYLEVLSAASTFSGPLQWRLVAAGKEKQRTLQTGSIDCSNSRGSAAISIAADSVELRFILLVNNNPAWDIDLSTVWLPLSPVRITELFPKATAAEPEWFEIANVSAMPVNLKNWRFGNSEDTVILTDTDLRIGPGAYAVVTKNAPALSKRYLGLRSPVVPPVWHTLDNTKDTLMLIDAAGVLRESVCWDAAWFDSWPYLSLERNNSDNGCSQSSWSVAERATPEQPNSAFYWRSVDTPSLDIGPVPFTPDNDGLDEKLAIRLALPAGASATVDIYGFDGRIIKRFSGLPQEVYYWDGRGNFGAAPPGPFFVVAEIKQGSRVQRIRKKGILWRK